MKHVVVVGASLAGVSAVDGLREHGFDGEITLLDAEEDLPYDKPPLSKQALAGAMPYEDLPLRPEAWYAEQRVSLRLGTRARRLDPVARAVHLESGAVLGYDGLVLATGSTARDVPVPCSAPERIHRLRTLEDSRRLQADLRPGRHLAIIGAGFIGLEVASTARQFGLDVTVVETAATPLGRVFGSRVGGWFRELHERHGVTLRCAEHLEGITDGPEGFTLHFSGGRTVVADVVVASVGASPQVGWLAGSGLDVSDGVRCASDLTTGVPDVVAAGDIATWRNPLFDEAMRVEHWTNAVEQGRHAAASLLGRREDYAPVPFFWTDQHDAKVRFVGRAAAEDDVVTAEPKPGSLVAGFGRHGIVRGAVCVNAPKQLATLRQAISNRTPWEHVVEQIAHSTAQPKTASVMCGASSEAPSTGRSTP